jgi:hypothetical protein
MDAAKIAEQRGARHPAPQACEIEHLLPVAATAIPPNPMIPMIMVVLVIEQISVRIPGCGLPRSWTRSRSRRPGCGYCPV